MEQLTREQIIEKKKETIKVLDEGSGDVTPYEQCLIDHDGECGTCDEATGKFLAC